jgi:hypothetical protein
VARPDRASNLLRLDEIGARELLRGPREEGLLAPLPHRLVGGIPALVVEAADEHRELGSELGDFLDREAVAERMQRGSQRQVASVPVVPAQLLPELVEPGVGLMNRRVEGIETGDRHRLSFLVFEE